MVYKIYISSRDDNDEYLVATQRALFSINEIAISAAMTDDIPVLGEKRQAAARMMIREARVFVGLYDANYGSVPEGETRSHEELEYQYAIDMNKSMLIFVMDDAIHNADDRQKQFLEHIMKNHVVTTFSDAEDLAAKIKVALASYRETEKHRRTLRPPVSSFRESLPSLPGQPSQEQEQRASPDSVVPTCHIEDVGTRADRALVFNTMLNVVATAWHTRHPVPDSVLSLLRAAVEACVPAPADSRDQLM